MRSQIQLRVDERITVDVALELGQTSESVQITADTPLPDTSTTSMGQVLSSKAVLTCLRLPAT
ncbi:MAG: hypothetical protein WKF37_23150 [Bryobacteraceae bacterium]